MLPIRASQLLIARQCGFIRHWGPRQFPHFFVPYLEAQVGLYYAIDGVPLFFRECKTISLKVFSSLSEIKIEPR